MEYCRKNRILPALLLLGLLASIETVAEPLCPLLYGKIKDKSSALLVKSMDWAKQYGTEVKENPFRLVIRPHKKPEKTLPLPYKIVNFLGNPIATTFNRPRQVTIPVSIAAWTAADYGLDKLNKTLEEKNFAATEKQLANFPIPGGAYAQELQKSGLISKADFTSLLKDHLRDLYEWANSPSKFTSRLDEMISLGVLSRAQAAKVDHHMRHAYNQCVQAANHDCWRKIDRTLRAMLQQDPSLSELRAEDTAILGTAFFPKISVRNVHAGFIEKSTGLKKRSDIHLVLALNAAPENAADPVGATALLLDQKKISYRDALAMTAQALDNPAGLAEKKSRAAKILPASKQSIAARPDIPMARALRTFNGRELKDELDYWQLLQTDARFTALKSAWLTNAIDDTSILRLLESQARGRESFALVHQTYGKKKLDYDGAALLFGIGSPTTLNPLLAEPLAALNQLVSDTDPEQKMLKKCMVDLAEFWRQYYIAEAQTLATQGGERFSAAWESGADARAEKYKQTQLDCLAK